MAQARPLHQQKCLRYPTCFVCSYHSPSKLPWPNFQFDNVPIILFQKDVKTSTTVTAAAAVKPSQTATTAAAKPNTPATTAIASKTTTTSAPITTPTTSQTTTTPPVALAKV